MIKSGMVIKHRRFMDVAIHVNKVYHFPQGCKIKGEWVNQAFEKTFFMGMSAKVKIKKEDLKDWLVCCNTKAECIRYEKWINL